MKRPNICQIVGQNDVSASQHTVYVSHNFPARKQMPSDFMAAVTIHSDFRAQEEEIRHSFHLSPGEGSGTPLQYSCLENPMDGGAW